MVQLSNIACVVFKTTGGKLWNKPWGLPKLTKTRKANRKKANALIVQNEAVLKEAASKDPRHFANSQQASAASN